MFDSDLIGVWVVDDSDISAKERYGSVSMTFTDDGSLEYIIHAEGGRQQKIFMSYRVTEPGVMMTNQETSPREELTEYEIDDRGRLILKLGGVVSTFVRASDRSPTASERSLH